VIAGIERRQSLSREEFYVRYKAGSRPVIIVDGMKDWPALAKWTPDYLDQVCGDEMVQVMAGRNSDANYEIRSDAHRTVMRFGDYVAKIKAVGQTNDFYLVAQNEFMKTAGARRLYDDIGAERPFRGVHISRQGIG
jgi:hypothetical protein